MIKEIIIGLIIGIIIGISFSVFAQNQTWWKSSNYQQSQENNKTSEVQIWCELRVQRSGWENYCKWTGKFWELSCLGMERFFGDKIEPVRGNYGCKDEK